MLWEKFRRSLEMMCFSDSGHFDSLSLHFIGFMLFYFSFQTMEGNKVNIPFDTLLYFEYDIRVNNSSTKNFSKNNKTKQLLLKN